MRFDDLKILHPLASTPNTVLVSYQTLYNIACILPSCSEQNSLSVLGENLRSLLNKYHNSTKRESWDNTETRPEKSQLSQVVPDQMGRYVSLYGPLVIQVMLKILNAQKAWTKTVFYIKKRSSKNKLNLIANVNRLNPNTNLHTNKLALK